MSRPGWRPVRCFACLLATANETPAKAGIMGAFVPAVEPNWRKSLCNEHRQEASAAMLDVRRLLGAFEQQVIDPSSVPTKSAEEAAMMARAKHSFCGMHSRDYVFIHDGLRVVFRRGCPDCGDVG